MQRAELTGLTKQLGRLEKSMFKIRALQEKGCAVDYSLHDVYQELNYISGRLQQARAVPGKAIAEELTAVTAKHQLLSAQFQALTKEVEKDEPGLVIASQCTLPDFFCRLSNASKGMWKSFEQLATLFGIGIMGFTIIGITYFLASGKIPFLQLYTGGNPLLKFSGFLVGVIMGLVAHEFAHGIVLANNGIKIKRVGAMAGSLIGGFIEADEAFLQADPQVRLRFNASSIGTNFLAAIIISLIGVLTSSDLLLFIALGNLFFGFINSFPVSPLDGGWVYEDLVNLYVTNGKLKKLFMSARFVLLFLWLILFSLSCLI
jgi:Zn-dependent protease